MAATYVGFYWTLPAPRSGFLNLPPDPRGKVDAAAQKSRTIRYQRQLVKQFINERPERELVGEVAFMEISPDRGTDAVNEAMIEISALCIKYHATMLYINFTEILWRRHRFMQSMIYALNIPSWPLGPEVIKLDDGVFNPIKHFRQSRQRDKTESEALRAEAESALDSVMRDLVGVRGCYKLAADDLNRKGVKTARGLPWSAEGVRKTYKRYNAGTTT